MSLDIPAADLPVAIGCMRLSTAAERDEEHGVAVLHAAFDAGVTLLDTADAYCWNDAETGHNERLIARALASWRGDCRAIRVATKGGLTRPEGRWVADGRGRALAAACARSLRALDVSRLHLYQLHAVDPRVSLSTSVKALRALQRDGLVEAVGLCNVTVGQIAEARQIVEIAAVQIELSLLHHRSVLSGVVGYCQEHDITLLAYRPLGGALNSAKLQSDPVLTAIAASHAATPHQIALAAIADLSPRIVPLPGPTRVDTARSSARFRRVALTDDDRERLAGRFAVVRARRGSMGAPAVVPPRTDGDVVIVMGLPGAGKSTLAGSLVEQGYTRINRDAAGGTLQGLLPELDRAIEDGQTRVVLDNTYVSRHSRAAVIQAASARGLPVRCLWLATSLEDAQINAVSRILTRHGRLLEPEELRQGGKRDPSTFGPMVQFRYARSLEPPDPGEGFTRIDQLGFERRQDPSFDGRAVIVWCDGMLFRSRSGLRAPRTVDDAEVIVERASVLRAYEAEGWKILGFSWLPEITDGAMTRADASALAAHVRDRLGVAIEIDYCAHAAGPPACWCRKPLPGLAVQAIHRHRLDPSRCIYVGSGAQDPGFARRLGFEYREAAEFFAARP